MKCLAATTTGTLHEISQGNQKWHAFVCFDPPRVENSISPVTINAVEQIFNARHMAVSNMTFYCGIQDLLKVIRD